MSTTDTVRLMPIDYALLELLPAEGETIGFTPIALQVRSILRKKEFEQTTAGEMTGRLKSMGHHGLVVGILVQPVGRGLGWQVTAKGKEVLANRREAMTA